MSVYSKESPAYFRECLESLVAQTMPANEVVLVEDGPLGEELHATIAAYSTRLNVVSLRLPINVGLGKALRAGLNICRSQYVARMDSDDISAPYRFEVQMAFLEANPEVDVLSGTWAEFDKDFTKPHSLRRLPSTDVALRRYAKLRNPINHVTAMFRKDSVLAAGSYQSRPGFEDYDLWARMLMLGDRLHNLDNILVYVRVGNGMQGRRGGFAYFRQDLTFQFFLLGIGLLSASECIRNILIRAPIRLAPESIRALCYRLFLRQRISCLSLGQPGKSARFNLLGLLRDK